MNTPLYQQVRDDIARRIGAGDWKPGAALPNEGDLAREYGVSPGTTRKALDQLESERLLSRRQGRGTFVNDHSSDNLASRYVAIHAPSGKRLIGDVASPVILLDVADDAERARLDLVKGDQVYRIRRLRTVDGKPFMLEHASVPASLFPNLQANGFAHRIVAMAQEHGVLLGKSVERISVNIASPDVAEALGVELGTPVAMLDRIVRSIDGDPVEWRLAWCELTENYYLASME
jgi:GntR family transcriptional regulator